MGTQGASASPGQHQLLGQSSPGEGNMLPGRPRTSWLPAGRSISQARYHTHPPKGPVSKKKPLEEEVELLGEEADRYHHDAHLVRGIEGHGMENRKRLLEWPRKVIQSYTFSNQGSWFAAPQLSWSLCLAWTPWPPESWPDQGLV